MEHWKFTGDEDKARECTKRAQRELDIHRDLVRLGNLSQYRTQRVFGDGLTVECRTVFNDEIVNVYYNPGGGKKVKILERRNLVPIMDLGPYAPFESGAQANVYLFWSSIEFTPLNYFTEGDNYFPERITYVFMKDDNTRVELTDLEMQYLEYDEGGGEVG